METAPHILEPTEATFTADVIDRSVDVPIVVDFWAPWCGPCRQLTPVLESLVAEFDGRFLLAKVNTDAEPGLAAAFQVQSIPTVVAIRDRQLVDQFQGALPEAAIREWIERLLPSQAEQLALEAAALEATDPQQAEARYRQAVTTDPQSVEARIGLARLLVEQQRLDEAETLLAELEARGFLEPEAEKVRSRLHLRRGGGATPIADLQQAVEADPGNLSLQLQLAEGQAAAGQTMEALETCLRIIPRDRAGTNGQAAKALMLDVLNTLEDPDLASQYRRRLASVLY